MNNVCSLFKLNPNIGDLIRLGKINLTCEFCHETIHIENIVMRYDGDFMAGVDMQERVHSFLPIGNDYVGCPHCGVSYRTSVTLYCSGIHEENVVEVNSEYR